MQSYRFLQTLLLISGMLFMGGCEPASETTSQPETKPVAETATTDAETPPVTPPEVPVTPDLQNRSEVPNISDMPDLPISQNRVSILYSLTWGQLPAGPASLMELILEREIQPLQPIWAGLTTEPQLLGFLAIPFKDMKPLHKGEGIFPAPWGSTIQTPHWHIFSEAPPELAENLWRIMQPHETRRSVKENLWDSSSFMEWLNLPLLHLYVSEIGLPQASGFSLHMRLLPSPDPYPFRIPDEAHTFVSWDQTAAIIQQLYQTRPYPWVDKIIEWNQQLVQERDKNPLGYLQDFNHPGFCHIGPRHCHLWIPAEDPEYLARTLVTLLLGIKAKLQPINQGYEGQWQGQALKIVYSPDSVYFIWGEEDLPARTPVHLWEIRLSGTHPRLQWLAEHLENPLPDIVFIRIQEDQGQFTLQVFP